MSHTQREREREREMVFFFFLFSLFNSLERTRASPGLVKVLSNVKIVGQNIESDA